MLIHFLFKSTYSLYISSCCGLGRLGVSEENEAFSLGPLDASQPVEEESCLQKTTLAISLAIVTVLIEIQTASKCERLTNLVHICLGCYLNYFPSPGTRQ